MNKAVVAAGLVVVAGLAVLGAYFLLKAPSGQEPIGGAATYWIKAIGGEGHDYAPSFLTIDDGYIVVGMSTSFGLGDKGTSQESSHDFLVVKLDKAGNLVWSKTIGGENDEQGPYSIDSTGDGGYLLTGYTESFGTGAMDMFVVKLGASGNLEWAKAIGGAGREIGKASQQTDDGGYIAVGETDSFGAGEKDVLVVRLSATGELVWAKAIGGSKKEKASSIEKTKDGNYIIGGMVESFGAGGVDSLFVKMDENGNILWSEAVGGGGDEAVNWDGVRVTTDGGYIIGDTTTSYGAQGNGDFFGLKLRSDGSLEWATMIRGPNYDVGWTMNETADGYIAGGAYTITSENSGDVLIVKFDQSGNIAWAKTFGGVGLDEIEEIKPVENGYLMTGVTRLGGNLAGDFLVAKVDGNGLVGDSSIIKNLSPTVASVSPTVTSISLTVTNISPQVTSVSPTVTSPSPQIQTIISA